MKVQFEIAVFVTQGILFVSATAKDITLLHDYFGNLKFGDGSINWQHNYPIMTHERTAYLFQ